MRDLDHPHLIKFYGTYETSKLLFIVMELCEGGELFGYMRQKFAPRGCMHKCCPCLLSLFGLIKKGAYSEQEVAMWLRQVCEGLVYLHSKRIVHADIKPQNILLKSKDKHSTVRIIDFGLSSAVKKKHLVRGQDGAFMSFITSVTPHLCGGYPKVHVEFIDKIMPCLFFSSKTHVSS